MLKILEQAGGKLTAEEWQQLGALLLKARYDVSIRREKLTGKSTTRQYIVAWGDGERREG